MVKRKQKALKRVHLALTKAIQGKKLKIKKEKKERIEEDLSDKLIRRLLKRKEEQPQEQTNNQKIPFRPKWI